MRNDRWQVIQQQRRDRTEAEHSRVIRSTRGLFKTLIFLKLYRAPDTRSVSRALDNFVGRRLPGSSR